MKWGSHTNILSRNRQEVNSTWYPQIEKPIKSRKKHYSLVLYILMYYIIIIINIIIITIVMKLYCLIPTFWYWYNPITCTETTHFIYYLFF